MLDSLRKYWHNAKFDKPFFWITLALVVVGLFVFTSAALSVLTKNPAQFYRILLSQYVLGLVGGLVVGFVIYKIPLTFWKKYALWLFGLSIIITALVFVPGLGVSHGGATRWLSLGPFSFQPAELLKIGFIMYASAWYASTFGKAKERKYGVIPLMIMLGLVGGLLLLQPDTGTFMVIVGTGIIMYFVSGAPLKDLGIFFLFLMVVGGVLFATRPYIRSRIKTFIQPSHDSQGASYQVQQAFIAAGSGKIFGRGYGQSVQKFHYLPEPTGDSVFAVAAEETGFVGSLIIVFLYVIFALRGLYIARRAPNIFGRLFVTGLVVTVVIQAFLNISSIIGLFPLTGLPLIFMSQGGTSLLLSLVSVALVLNVSQHMKRLPQEEQI